MKFRYFIFSLILHLLFAWGVKTSLPQARSEIAIELLSNAAVGSSSAVIQDEKKSVKSKTTSSSGKIDFGISTRQAAKESFLGGKTEKQQARSFANGDDSTNDFMNPYNGLQMHEIRFVQSLWHEIDRSIVDSPYLSEYGHTGRVQLKFEIGMDGKLIESTLKANADDRVLKVIAARAVRKALMNERGQMVVLGERIAIETRFAWLDYRTCASLNGAAKTSLSFCRYAEDKRKSFSNGEKAQAYLSSLKYGFDAIDEIRKYKQEEMRRDTGFNPFQEFEKDRDWDLGG